MKLNGPEANWAAIVVVGGLVLVGAYQLLKWIALMIGWEWL